MLDGWTTRFVKTCQGHWPQSAQWFIFFLESGYKCDSSENLFWNPSCLASLSVIQKRRRGNASHQVWIDIKWWWECVCAELPFKGTTIQRDPDRLEKWPDNNLTKSNRDKLKDCIWSRLTPCNDMDWGLADLLGYSFAGRGLRSRGESGLNVASSTP